MAELTRKRGRNEKREATTSRPGCFCCFVQMEKVKPVCQMTVKEEDQGSLWWTSVCVCVCVCVCVHGGFLIVRVIIIYSFIDSICPQTDLLFLLLYCIQNKRQQNALHPICLVWRLHACAAVSCTAQGERGASRDPQTVGIHSTTWRQGTSDPPLQAPPHCL